NSSLFNCNYDSFGNEFCPSNLAKAESYWDYDNGYSIPKVGQVVDYTKKENSTTYTQSNYQLQKWSIVSYTCTNGGNPNDNCGKGLTGGRYKIANYDWVNVTEANVLTG
ncbi:hypothetical protein ACOL23_12205, partial [Aliarcobacter butzleri]